MVVIPITDYFKLFLSQHNISVTSDVYTSFVEILISLAKSKIYDIDGNRRDEEYQELATLFHNANMHILIDREFEEQIDNISNELITFLLINGDIDKVIYLVGVTNNYNTFNSYRL
jgi:hypothetical protein